MHQVDPIRHGSLHQMEKACDNSQMGKLTYNIDNITFIESPYVHPIASSHGSDDAIKYPAMVTAISVPKTCTTCREKGKPYKKRTIRTNFPFVMDGVPYHIDCLNMNRYSSIDWSQVTSEQRAAYEEAKKQEK